MLDATTDSDPEHEHVQNEKRLCRQQYALQNSKKLRPREQSRRVVVAIVVGIYGHRA